MMGTGPFSAPTFEELCDSRHEVLALVTQPPRDRAARPEILGIAEERSKPIYRFENVNAEDARAELARLEPDLFIVADYGQILKSQTLAIARLGGINLHGSLLPKYRGAAPIPWAIYHGDAETGVTVIHMTPQVDGGPCLAREKTAIGAEEDAVALENRLARLGSPLTRRVIDDLENNLAIALPQEASLVTPARRLKKSDGAVDWNRPGSSIKNQVRAFVPWPKTYTFWRRPTASPLRLILEGVTPVAVSPSQAVAPGVVLEAESGTLIVQTGEGGLKIERVQPAGKRTLTSAEFLRGYPVRRGDRFESEDPADPR